MTNERMAPEAIEQAVRGMMTSMPIGATGVYITGDGISYGYHPRSCRDTALKNYIWFEPALPRYTEDIQATRSGTDAGDDVVTLVMNTRQAYVLSQLSRRISGEPRGPRGVLDALGGALRSVLPNMEPRGYAVSFNTGYSMSLYSGNHDPA